MKTLIAYKKSVWEFYSQSEDKKIRAYAQKQKTRLLPSHEANARNIESVIRTANECGLNTDVLYRGDVTTLEKYDLIIPVGGDGTFIDVAHYVQNGLLLGVNSDPRTKNPNGSYGFYLSQTASTLKDALQQFDSLPRILVARLNVKINGSRIAERALNEILFADENPAGPHVYTVNGEFAKDSGLLISTKNGVSGWAKWAGGVEFSDDSLCHYVHRESSFSNGYAKSVQLKSHNRTGMIYIDGKHKMYPVTFEDTVHVEVGDRVTVLGLKNTTKK